MPGDAPERVADATVPGAVDAPRPLPHREKAWSLVPNATRTADEAIPATMTPKCLALKSDVCVDDEGEDATMTAMDSNPLRTAQVKKATTAIHASLLLAVLLHQDSVLDAERSVGDSSGADGGKRMAEEYGLAHLGSLPLNLSIRQQADAGCPTVVAEPDGEIAALYRSVARGIAIRIADKAKDYSSKFPTITISKST